MALAHAILSVLVSSPCSGYDLAKKFDQTVESSVGFFWEASFQQIYRELNRLEEKGWLQAEKVLQENRPDKKIYSVTTLGKQQLCEWIAEPEEPTPFKDDLLVKLYTGYLVKRETILAKLEMHRREHQQRLVVYQEIEKKFFQKPQELSDELKFNYVTLQRGIHYERGWLAWCDEMIPFLSSPAKNL
ncbi:PadR family transcriptional regulator [Fortiea sp. LEGE XX443]|uniref:PadR family transcriptional regulator n=1 Tax=Fortiea sp. LEGE XX443 TaxID=1828611 RepID=UPI001880EDA0|nr:PadR family transcriptional regulator [Fortiea sp. LEGE XX443]MBE9004810.1 PadR family transcriptional regulator [Fortiea sp. LEGE XX443]